MDRFTHSQPESPFSWMYSRRHLTDSEFRALYTAITADSSWTVCTNIAFAGIFIVGIIALVGIIANILTVVVFWKGNFKSSTCFLLSSLSLINSAVLLTVFTPYIARLCDFIGWLPHDLRAYLLVCTWPLCAMAETATICLTVLIAVNRYIIVCRPLRASRWCTLSKVKKQLAVVLVLAVMYTIPQFVRYRVVHITRNNGMSYEADIDNTMELSFPQFYYVYDNILPLIVLVCLPLFILTLLTIRLIKAMKAHRRMQAEMQSQNSQPDNSMTFALVIVIIVFIICRAPHLIWSVMSFLEWSSYVAKCYVFLMYVTLLTINSAVNFLIYIVTNSRFRNVLCATVCRRRSAISVVTANTMTKPETVKRETSDGCDTRL